MSDENEKNEKPSVNADDVNTAKPVKTGRAWRIISNVICFIILACAVLMFLPDGFCPKVNTDVSELANDKLLYCYVNRNSEIFGYLFKKYGKLSEVKFSCEEMHYLFNNRFLNNEAINMDTLWEAKNVSFKPLGDKVKVTLYTKFAGVIPATFTVVGKVEKRKSSFNPIGFKVKSARMGWLPFFGKSSQFVMDKFKPLVACLPEISTSFNKSSEVKFEDGNFVFKLK